MIGRILIALGAIAIYKLCQRYIALQKNIALAEKSGLKYMVLRTSPSLIPKTPSPPTV
jgi:hypothetical protein